MTGSVLFHWFLSLMLPLCFGYILLNSVLRTLRVNGLQTLALSYGLGLGILTQWMLILGMLEIPFSLSAITLPLSLFSLVLWFFGKSNAGRAPNMTPLFPVKADEIPSRNSLWIRIFYSIAIVYISFNLFYIFWYAVNVPLRTWDAVAISGFRAKVFFFDGSLHRLNLPFPSYPLHIPLIESWISLNLKSWNDFLIKIIFPLALFSYLIIQYSFLKSVTNKKWAVGGICLLLSSNFLQYHSMIGYRDIFMMYYNCTTIILLILWSVNGNSHLLILSSLFAGLTTFVKLEGTQYLFIHTILVIMILFINKDSIKKKFIKFITFALPSYVICSIFHIYKMVVGVSGMAERTDFALTWAQLSRLPDHLHFFVFNLFLSGNWHILWFLLVVSLVWHRDKIVQNMQIKLLFCAMMLFFAVYIVFLTLTSASIDNPTTLTRVFLHFFPLCVMLIILLNYPGKMNLTEQKSPQI